MTQLRNIGIALEIRSFEFATFYADINRGNFDLFSLRWIGSNDDPDILYYCFSSKNLPPSGANRVRYSNLRSTALLEEARTGVRPGRPAGPGHAAAQSILNRELPYISLWYLDDVVVYNRRLQNLRLSAAGNYDFLTEVEIQPTGQE